MDWYFIRFSFWGIHSARSGTLHARVPAQGRARPRGRRHLVRQVGVGAAVEQEPHDLDVAVLGGHHQLRDFVLPVRAAVMRRRMLGAEGREGMGFI